jgi:hypothetical protein
VKAPLQRRLPATRRRQTPREAEQQGEVAGAMADVTVATTAQETAQVPVLPVEVRRSLKGGNPR